MLVKKWTKTDSWGRWGGLEADKMWWQMCECVATIGLKRVA
jgi:hypothetical protein